MIRRIEVVGAWALVALLASTAIASAHEIRPALLEITERDSGWVDVTWKVPMRGDRVLGLEPVLPPGLTRVADPASRVLPGALVQRTTYRSDGQPWVGKQVSVDGLSATQIDVLLRIDLADGSSHSAILRPSSPSFVVPAEPGTREVAWSYFSMGMIHILAGIDHLLFLLALLLLVSGFSNLLKTITAFTLAHSVTLALATLGLVRVPAAPTEAIIALSVVFVATEIVRSQRGEPGLTERYPWAIAFTFGLFHGLGFAGALSEVGVPANEVPLALLMFNVGVEAGQILFVAAVVGMLFLARRIRLPARTFPSPSAWRLGSAYAVGGLAAFWTIQRVASFLP